MMPQIGKGSASRRGAITPRVPDGVKLYAVGDIHGRVDLLNQLLDLIIDDMATTTEDEAWLLFLGDYVDRGPDSRLVIETLRHLKERGGERVITLKGNHEEAFLKFLEGSGNGPAWAEHGGRETLMSYGVVAPRHRSDLDGWAEARAAFAKAVPPAHLRFLRGLGLSQTVGDYLFVHAGVRPGVPMEDQEEQDLLWIREDFLREDHRIGKVVVHGHTPTDTPIFARSRIGIDTGAYATGVLTALKLWRDSQTYIQTGPLIDATARRLAKVRLRGARKTEARGGGLELNRAWRSHGRGAGGVAALGVDGLLLRWGDEGARQAQTNLGRNWERHHRETKR